MLKGASKLKTFRRQGITILILLLALGTYFAVLVPAQRSFLIHRSFRVLADMGKQFNGALANLGSSLANAALTPAGLSLTDTNNSRFLQAMSRDSLPATPGGLDYTNQIHSALRLVPNLQLLSLTTGGTGGTNSGTEATGIELAVRGSGRAAWLQLDFRGSQSNVQIVARSELSRLIEPIINRGEFDEVLLLDTNGTVLFQLGTSALQVTRLSVPSDKSFHTNLVNLAGAEYLLFAQPIQFTPAGSTSLSAPATTDWILCGLVRSERFGTETRSVNYTVLVLFTFLALLLVLSWPFLNVWSLSRRGGLRPGEVFLLISSTLAMNAFLTLLVLNLFALLRIQDRFDHQLEGFADALERNLRTELQQIARQTTLLNQRFLTSGNAISQVDVLNRANLVQLTNSPPDPYPYFQMAVWSATSNGDQLAKWTVKEQNTPRINIGQRAYFQALAENRPWSLLVDSQRVEFCLEPIYSVNTGENLAAFAMRSPGDRRVLSMLDTRLLSLVNPVVPAGFGFCVVDSSGRVLFHSDGRRNLRENFFEECNHDPRLRAAVLGRLADRFHTHYANQDHSCFVRPLEDLPWSLVTFRQELVVGTAQVEMVSVAVFLFLLHLGAMTGLIGLACLIGARRCLTWLWPSAHRAGTYGLLTVVNLILIGIFAGALCVPGERGWSLLAALVLPLTAVLIGLMGLSRGWMGSAWLRWAARSNRLGLSYRTGYVLAMGTLLLLLASLPMVAFFKTAFELETRLLLKQAQLRLAQDLEARTQRIWGEIFGISGAQQVKGRALAMPNRREFFTQRLTNDWDVYSGFFFDTKIRWTTNAPVDPTNIPGSSPSLVERWLPLLRPHYNEQDVLTRSVAGTGAHDGAWFWTNRVNQPMAQAGSTKSGPRFELTKTAVHVPMMSSQQRLHIDSAEPDWGGSSWLWGMAFLSLLGLPFLVGYIVAKNVLLLNFTTSSGASRMLLDPENLASQPPFGPGKYLLLGPPRSGKSRQLVAERFSRLQVGMFHRVDLRNPEDHQWLDPAKTDQLMRETDKAIVVDNFDFHHEDAEFSRAKLHFLQQVLLDEARTVVVVSNIHPLNFCLTVSPGEKGKSEQATAPDATSWADVLTCFYKLYTQGRWHPGSALVPEGQTTLKARSLYRSIWLTCSPAERELLHELAQGRLVSSYHPELAPLLERGLLRRDPALRLIDEPFQRFVLANHRPGAVILGEPEDAPGLWQSLKGPTVTVIIILAGFFFVTQKEMWNNTLVLVTTFLTGIGAFAKAFEIFQKNRIKQTSSE